MIDYGDRVRSFNDNDYGGIRSRASAVGIDMVEQDHPLETAPDIWDDLPPVIPPF